MRQPTTALPRCRAHPRCAALPAAAHCYLTWSSAQHAAPPLRSLHVTVCTGAARCDGCSCPHVYTTCSIHCPLHTGSPASSRADRLHWDLMGPWAWKSQRHGADRCLSMHHLGSCCPRCLVLPARIPPRGQLWALTALRHAWSCKWPLDSDACGHGAGRSKASSSRRGLGLAGHGLLLQGPFHPDACQLPNSQ